MEDLFTIFDQCLFNNEQFKGKSIVDIDEAYYYLLDALRVFLIHTVRDNIEKKVGEYRNYHEFVELIINKRIGYFNQKRDKIAIISLNWDFYLEKLIDEFKRDNRDKINILKKLFIDYCTYDYTYSNNNNNHIPSQGLKHAGKINLKILKPHGSANWGYCSNCGRFYYSYGKNIKENFDCKHHCNDLYDKSVELDPVLITPTFLKEITIRPLIDIWNNIGIELSEADNIIFIGYSMRKEDFYFKFMLSKYIKSTTNLFIFDNKNNDNEKENLKNTYIDFFQLNKNIEFHFNGWGKDLGEITKILDKE